MKRFLLIGVVVLAAGCERVDYIELEPSQVVFKQMNNQQYISAHVMARTGVRAANARVAWEVTDPNVATIDANGILKPVKSGSTEFIARYKGKEARGQVNVVLVDHITVEPTSLTMKDTDSAQPLKVRAFAEDGRELDDRTPTMQSNDQKVVRIVGGGGVMPLNAGKTTVDVQVDAVKASVEVTVEVDKSARK